MICHESLDKSFTQGRYLSTRYRRCTMDTERTLNINIAENDARYLFDLAAEHGISMAELIENFLNDLSGGNRRNGSDESRLAKNWFDRCWFGMFPEETFVHYLLERSEMDEFMDELEYFEDLKEILRETDDEGEKAGYQMDCEQSKNELENYYQKYLKRYSKHEKTQSFDDSLRMVRKYRQKLFDWMNGVDE